MRSTGGSYFDRVFTSGSGRQGRVQQSMNLVFGCVIEQPSRTRTPLFRRRVRGLAERWRCGDASAAAAYVRPAESAIDRPSNVSSTPFYIQQWHLFGVRFGRIANLSTKDFYVQHITKDRSTGRGVSIF